MDAYARHHPLMDKGTRKIVSPETRALLDQLRDTVIRLRDRAGNPSIEHWAESMGVGYGTLHRVLTGGAGPTGEPPPPNLEFLVRVAAHFGCQAWQLLTPGFDPDNPPQLPGAKAHRGKVRERV